MMEKRSWSEAFCRHVDRRREKARRPVGFFMSDDGPLRMDSEDGRRAFVEWCSHK